MNHLMTMGGHQMQNGMMMAPMMMVGFVFMIVVVAALIAGVVWLVRNLTGDHGTSGRPSAIEQLELRYARGEIDRDDYLQRRDDLQRA